MPEFNEIKTDFIAYLEKTGTIVKKDKDNEPEINIFDYGDEFGKFIKENYTEKEISLLTMYVSEFSDFELDYDYNFSLSDDKEDQDDSFLVDMMDELLKSQDFRDSIDTNRNGKIEKGELEDFLNEIASFDEDEENLSFDDILEGILKAKDISIENDDNSNIADRNSSYEVPPLSNTNYSQSGYSSSGGGGYSSNVSRAPQTNTTTDKVDLSSFDYSAEMAASNENMQNLYSGKNPEILAAKTDMQTKQGLYQNALKELKGEDEANAQKLSSALSMIEKAQEDTIKAFSDLSEAQAGFLEASVKADTADATYQGLSAAFSANSATLSELNSSYASMPDTIEDSEGNQIPNSQKQILYERIQTLNAEQIRIESEMRIAQREYESAISEANDYKEKIQTQQDKITSYQEEIESWENYKQTLEEGFTQETKTILEGVKAEFDAAKELYEDLVSKEINSINETQTNSLSAYGEYGERDKARVLSDIQYKNTVRFVADTTPVHLDIPLEKLTDENREQWQIWWRDNYGYNIEYGNTLAETARRIASEMEANGSNGNCLGGVKKTFAELGEHPYDDIHQGALCISYLENSDEWREIYVLSVNDLDCLPQGAQICWSKSDGTDAASLYGHISISLGDGYEASDHVCRQYHSVGAATGSSSGKYRVFIPVK